MQPHKMMRAQSYPFGEAEGLQMAYLCCQCNLCELFSCPAGLHPKMANMSIKAMLAKDNIRYQRTQEHFSARSVREYRLVPSKRLIARLGLRDFDRPAPLSEITLTPEVVAQPMVSVGQHVDAGQMIGSIPADSLGAAIHASVSGSVITVTPDYIEIRRQ